MPSPKLAEYLSLSKLKKILRNPRRGQVDKPQENIDTVAKTTDCEYNPHEAPGTSPDIESAVSDETSSPGNVAVSAATGNMETTNSHSDLEEAISPPVATSQNSNFGRIKPTVAAETPGTAAKHALTHKALWEKAYHGLKSVQSKAKYVTRYEEILSTVILGEREAGQDLGEERMKEIVARGLEKIEKSKLGLSEKNLRVVMAVKSMLDMPLQKIPQAALPWAIISSSVDILLKPVKAGMDLYNGVNYAVTRIEWYSHFTDNLLNQTSIEDQESLGPMREIIETRLVDLYQSLLFFQIQSVCVYHEKYRFIFLLTHGILDLENWSGDLQGILNAEQRLLTDCSLYRLVVLKPPEREIHIDSKIQEASEILSARLEAIRHVNPAVIARNIQDRKEVPIDELYTWIFDTDSFKQFCRWDDGPRRLWISGQAGTGKTMFLLGAIKQIQARRLLSTVDEKSLTVIYFFCQLADDQLNNGTAILRSLVWMLLYQQPDLAKHLDGSFSSSGDKLLSDQDSFSSWGDILINMLNDCGKIVIFIDAIDECDEVSRKHLKSFLEKALHMELPHVKWLLTSRPIPELPGSLPGKAVLGHSLLNLDDCDLHSLVKLYIHRKMATIAEDAKNKTRTAEIEDQLCERSSNTFIWVSLVISKLEDSGEIFWKDILDQIPKDLSKLYEYLLSGLEFQLCRDVLAVAIVARRPLTLSEIEHLTGLEAGLNAGEDCVRLCKSFLILRGDTVYWLHQSAQDWLLMQHRQLRDQSLKQLHAHVYSRSLEGLNTILKENIYMLSHYGVLTGEVKPPTDNPLSPISYSCQSWVYHLQESNSAPTSDILAFLEAHFLHWIEAMALLGLLPETVHILDALQSLNTLHENSALSKFLLDAKRFILKNTPAVAVAPLQLYVSALIFTPKASIVRGTGCLPRWIREPPEVDRDWGFLLQTLEHPSTLRSVTFSNDDKLVIGADKHSVKIWDTATGALKREVGDKRGRPDFWSLGLSPDGQFLATGSINGEVLIWETEKWNLTQSLIDPPMSCPVKYTVFSPNSQLFACSYGRLGIKVWEKSSTMWNFHWELRYEEGSYGELSFSHNSLLLAAPHYDHPNQSILIFDMETGEIQHRIQHLSYVRAAKFSTDGTFFLASCDEQGILIWNTSDWNLIRTIRSSNYFNSLCLSPDLKYIAASDQSITVFERETGVVFQTLKGHHTKAIKDVTFSSDGQLLASCGYDKTIQIWAVGPGESTDLLLQQAHRIAWSKYGIQQLDTSSGA
ncbi:unnamed protein product [Penicillium glandicola]